MFQESIGARETGGGETRQKTSGITVIDFFFFFFCLRQEFGYGGACYIIVSEPGDF